MGAYQTLVGGESSLTGYWKLDEAVGASTFADSKGSLTLTIAGGVTCGGTGLVDGNSASFNGSTGKASAASSPANSTSSASIEAWGICNNSSTAFRQCFVMNGVDGSNGYGITVGSFDTKNGNFWVVFGGGTWNDTGIPAVNGRRRHVVATVNSGTFKLYVDGALGWSSSTTPGAPTAFSIGSTGNAASWLDGSLDEVAAYNAPLTDAQVLDHYNAGVGRRPVATSGKPASPRRPQGAALAVPYAAPGDLRNLAGTAATVTGSPTFASGPYGACRSSSALGGVYDQFSHAAVNNAGPWTVLLCLTLADYAHGSAASPVWWNTGSAGGNTDHKIDFTWGRARLAVGNSYVTANSTVKTDRPVVLAGTYDGTTASLYQDGSLEASGSKTSGTGTFSASRLMFGQSGTQANIRLHGALLIPAALPASSIAALSADFFRGFRPGPRIGLPAAVLRVPALAAAGVSLGLAGSATKAKIAAGTLGVTLGESGSTARRQGAAGTIDVGLGLTPTTQILRAAAGTIALAMGESGATGLLEFLVTTSTVPGLGLGAVLGLSATGSYVNPLPCDGTLGVVLRFRDGNAPTPVAAGTAGALRLGLRGSARIGAAVPAGGLDEVVATDRARRHPDCYAETPGGVLLIANGVDPMLRWDGTGAAEEAGVAGPTATPVLAADLGPADPLPASPPTYVAYLRFVDRHGNVSDLSPVSDQVTTQAGATFTYTGVETPADLKVARRQLLRNTAGQRQTFYVDVDTEDLTSASFSSSRTDADLSAQEAFALFDFEGDTLASAFGVPPSWKSAIAAHLGRLFAAADVTWAEGSVEVTSGSATVVGRGTRWPRTFAGRTFAVVGDGTPYPVAAVDTAAQTLTLESPYLGPTDAYARYAIRPAPEERKRVYWSYPGGFESWDPLDAFAVQEDGDEVTGLMQKDSFLYILERRHIYRFTMKDDPARDGFTFLSVNRGCLNNRLWAISEGVAYMLDDQGVHAFAGGQDSEPVSEPVQDLFRPASGPGLRVNWAADSTLWHAAADPVRGVVRFFVHLSGAARQALRHALCYDYRRQMWWVEEYPRPATSSCVGTIGLRRLPLCGSTGRRVLALGASAGDGRVPSAREAPAAVTPLSAVLAAGAAPGDPIAVAAGRGAGQTRTVVSAGSGRAELDRPWAIEPDATSAVVLGGVTWRWSSGWWRLPTADGDVDRSLLLGFAPTRSAATLDLERAYDYGAPGPAGRSSEEDGVRAAEGESALVIDLARPRGWVQVDLAGHASDDFGGDRTVSVSLSGVQGPDPVKVRRLEARGAEA